MGIRPRSLRERTPWLAVKLALLSEDLELSHLSFFRSQQVEQEVDQDGRNRCGGV